MKASRFVSCMALGGLLAALVAGCSTDKNNRHRSRDRIDSRDRVDTRDRVDSRDRSLPSDAELPRTADRVKSSRGENMSYTADRDGRVYVYDRDKGSVVYSGSINRDERITVRPDRNRIDIEGKSVSDKDLTSDHEFEIYFDRR